MDKISRSEPLASGRTADIYAWDEGYVLKRYHEWFELEDIQYEAKITRAIHASGLPAPLAGEILQLDGSYSLVYERVDGTDMFAVLKRRPWRVVHFARKLAALHAGMHARVCPPGFPSQPERLERKIRRAALLTTKDQSKILDALHNMPSGDRICHGDFHPGNVLLAEEGEVVIDWMDATCGNPLADVARSSIIAQGVVESEQLPNSFLRALVRLFHALYIRQYFRLRPGDVQQYPRWLPIVAAARLSEGIPELEAWLLEQAQEIL